jgi:hypothetical protein
MADEDNRAWYAVTDSDWDWDTTEDGDGAPYIALTVSPLSAAQTAVEAWATAQPNRQFDGGHLKVARVECVGFVGVEQQDDVSFKWDEFQWLGAPPWNENAASDIINEIYAERMRQVHGEGFTTGHDDNEHDDGELARAAGCYALAAGASEPARDDMLGSGSLLTLPRKVLRRFWPWWDDVDDDGGGRGDEAPSWSKQIAWWKPKDRRRDLVRAGALIVAEIERIDRAAARKAGGAHG